jgi:HSP20 family protein
MNLFSLSPLAAFESEFDRLFEAATRDFHLPREASGRFLIDLYEDNDNSYVRAELPGVTRDQINVELVDEYLTITVSPKGDKSGEDSFASFSRSIAMRDHVDPNKVTASCDNGVLTVTLPKKEESKPRKISVSVN